MRRLLEAAALAGAAYALWRAGRARQAAEFAAARQPRRTAPDLGDAEDVLANAWAILQEFLTIIHPDECPTTGELNYADLGVTAGIIAAREAAVAA